MTPITRHDPPGSQPSDAMIPAASGPAAGRDHLPAESPSTEAFLDRLRQLSPPAVHRETPVIPGVTILELVGRGGMGVVYRGRIDATGADVAVKVLSGAGAISASAQARARREAEILARLDHPNIVRVLSSGSCPGAGPGDEPVPFIVMEWIDGGRLDRFVGPDRLGYRDAVRLIRDVTLAAAEVHALGVIHRDIKPANILLGPSSSPGALPVPKLADFGLACLEQTSTPLTREGTVLGTPGYLAPEQAGGDAALGEVGPAADIHGLGATLYYLLAGRPPHEGRTFVETLARAIHGTVNWTVAPIVELPTDLRTILGKCLEKHPERRYASAGDLAEDLEALLAGRPIRARRESRLERLAGVLRRNPAGLAAVAIAGVSLLVLATGMRVHLERIGAADEAERESSELARSMVARLTDESVQQLLAAGHPLDERGRQLLVEARDTYLDWPLQGDLRETLLFKAKGLTGVAQAFGRITLVNDAADCFAASRAIFDDLVERGLADRRVNRQALDERIAEFRFLIESGRAAEAEPLVSQALALADGALDPVPPPMLRALLLVDRGFVLSVLGRHDDAAPIIAEALDAFEESRFASPDDPGVALEEQAALHNAAICAANAGRRDEQIARLRALVRRADKAAKRFPGQADEFRRNAMKGQSMLAAALFAAGLPEECLTAARRVEELATSSLASHPGDPFHRGQIIEAAIWESRAANVLNRPLEAAASIGSAVQRAEAFVAEEPAVFFHTQRLVTALREQAMHCAAVGRPGEAIAAYDRIREVLAPWQNSDAQREIVSSWIASASGEAAGVLQRSQGDGAGKLPEDSP